MNDRSGFSLALERASRKLAEQLQSIDIYSIDIHDYSRHYLKKYLDNIQYEIKLNSSILAAAMAGENEPESITILDFGGGIGMLSLLARSAGIRSVIYYDRDDRIRDDFHSLMFRLKVTDIELFSSRNLNDYIDRLNDVEVVISRDVIEHVYDTETWFREFSGITKIRTIVHNTSANMYCIWLRRYFREVHEHAEIEGYSDDLVKADTSPLGYADKRRRFLKGLGVSEGPDLDMYTERSRGLDYSDMTKWYAEGAPIREMDGSNTCDPETGNWAEKLISLRDYRRFGEVNGFEFEVRGGVLDVKGSFLSRLIRGALNYLNRSGFTGPAFWPSLTLIYRR